MDALQAPVSHPTGDQIFQRDGNRLCVCRELSRFFFFPENLAQAVDAEGRESCLPQPGAGGMGGSLLRAGFFQVCSPFWDAHL